MLEQRTLLSSSLFLIVLFLFSCGGQKKAPESIDPAFREHVSAYTSNAISRQGEIRVRLVEPVEDPEKRKELQEKVLFEFDPAIQGKVVWRDLRTLEFVPDEPLPSGQEYYAAFELGKVLDVPEKLNTLEFGFRVRQQDLRVHLDGTDLYRQDELEKQMLKGILYTADIADEKEVEQTLRAEQSGKELGIRWEHDVDGKTHHFIVDSLTRKEEKDSVELFWKGAPIGVEKKGKEAYEIPAIGDFKVMSVEMNPSPEQHLLIRFSDPLDQEQDLNGIVRMEDGTALRTSISGNEVKAYPEKTLSGEGTVHISPSLENILGHRFDTAFKRTVLFEDIKPQVKLLGDGTIMPDGDGLHLPFKAVNLNAVDVRVTKIYENNIPQFFQVNEIEDRSQLQRVGQVVHTEKIELEGMASEKDGRWTSYHLDLSKMISKEGRSAIYRVELGFPIHYSDYPCEGSEEQDKAGWENQFLDPDMGGYRSGGYYNHNNNWREKDDPCSESYYYGKRTVVGRNVFASNIGLLAKKGEKDELLCVANDIRSTEPLSETRIQVLNYQQQTIGRGKTDEDGKVRVDLDGDPYLLVARKDGEKGYLRVDDKSTLSTSKFDVSGQSLKEGLKGFLYKERGVHRPGDTVHLSFMLDDREMPLPKDHPVELEVKDSRGQRVLRRVKKKGEHGLLYFPIPTKKEAPTGNWYARVKVGGASFSERLRVETIKPNRLRIETDWDLEILRANDDGGKISSSWLHGATAQGLKTEVEASLKEKHGHFSDHEDYRFSDPIRSFSSSKKTVFEGKLDQKGETRFQSRFEVGKGAPGMLQADYSFRVYERGGNASVHRESKTFSPYNSYIGMKMPETQGRWGGLKSDKDHEFRFKSVDQNGDPISGRSFVAKVYRIERDWWYDHSRGRDLGEYIRKEHQEPVHSERLTSDGNGEAAFEMDFEGVRWGYYVVRACEVNGEHCTGERFRVSKYGRPPKGEGEEANLLSLTTDKDEYEVGEEATVTVPSGGEGRVLLSFEDGSKVLDTEWKKAGKDTTRFRFEVTEEMAPNIHAFATLIQPHSDRSNELPLRLYGVTPVHVHDPATKLEPELDMPEELAPEEEFTLSVSEGNGNAMSYSVAIVDEGLLDLTNFQTPDPWGHFYAKEAHGVDNWDLYDNVMGALNGQLRNVLEVGGGGQAREKEKGEVDRFDPVVKYLGPFELETGETQKHQVKMPNYIGSVRTMLVAGRDGAYGSTEETTPVKKPLMVLSTLPRVLGPKEKVKLPVSVFAMDESVDDVEIEVRSNELFKGNGSMRKSISFAEPGEELVSFDLELAERIGKGEVEVIAKGGGEEARHRTEIEVRNPNPEVTVSDDAVLEPGEEWSTEMELPGVAGTNSGVLEFSSIPSMNSDERLKDLIAYPHGCVEQVVSRAFPQLYVDRISELSAKEKTRIDEHVDEALSKLRDFQNSQGGFSYWPGRGGVNSWSSSYAGHFMLEAEEKGYELPHGMKQDWLEDQSRAARNWDPPRSSKSRYYVRRRQITQAYRLYTLALADEAVLSAMNRMRRSQDLTTQARWRLAAAYHLAGQKDVARQLSSGTGTEIPDYREMSHTYGSSTRDRAMILETLTLMGKEEEGMRIVRDLAEALRSGQWMSTQTTAWSLLAISKYLGEEGSSEHMSFAYRFDSGKNGDESTQLPVSKVEMGDEELKEGNRIQVENNGEGKLFVRSVLRGKPAQGDEKEAENQLRMDVHYTDMEGDPIDVSRIEQGTDFIAEVKVENPGTVGDYKEMALTRVFPSGWEIRDKRLGSDALAESAKTYEDVRDDRVMTYFDLSSGKTKTFKVRLHASYLGSFYHAGVYCEAMYDRSINARVPGEWVDVVKPGELGSSGKERSQ